MNPPTVDRLNASLSGSYTVLHELGTGGMATVYLADDLKHNRKVALKVMRPELAAVVGSDRFLAEIEVTAGLQHPHILPLFDSGAADGFLYYVMPYVEGDTLADRLEREKQLPVEEAVLIASDVAGALDHAHRAGVVHRDIKPANILLQDGRPMVADFGIALAVQEAGGGRLTETGMSLGTPFYMSPEQATGDREVDARSDVYALGSVLYEMLTGEPPYTGSTAQAVLGRILMGSPVSPTEHRKAIPAHVEAVVMKALEKLPADRFATAAEFARAIRDPAFRHGQAAAAAGTAPDTRRWRSAAAAAFVVAVAAIGWSVARGPGDDGHGVRRHHLVLGTSGEAVATIGLETALHPLGRGVVYSDTVDGHTSYWWKEHSAAVAVELPNMQDALAPTFSPDGEWLAYVKDAQLRKQPLFGGTSVTLAEGIDGSTVQALAWLDDGTIVFEWRDWELHRIPEDGGAEPVLISTEQTGGRPIHVSGLRGGGGALISGCDVNCGRTWLSVVDFGRDTVIHLVDDVFRAWHAPGGVVVYVDNRGAVYAARLDARAGSLGSPIPLFDGVRVIFAGADVQLGADGSLLYATGAGASTGFEPVWVDRAGNATPVDPNWAPEDIQFPAISPDGANLLLTVITSADDFDVWVKELPDGPMTSLTAGEPRAERGAWSVDGLDVYYIADDSSGFMHVRRRRADGTSPASEVVVRHTSADLWDVRVAPAGQLYGRVGTTGVGDLFYMENDADTLRELLVGPFDEGQPAVSPDGSSLAYTTDQSGDRPEVFVRPFPETGAGQVQVSRDTGFNAAWHPSGAELFYRSTDGWMNVAAITTEPRLAVTMRTRLFDASAYRLSASRRMYDVSPDGERLLMIRRVGTGDTDGDSSVILIENYFEELREVVRR